MLGLISQSVRELNIVGVSLNWEKECRPVIEMKEWGTPVNPWLIHINVWQKPPQYCKVISLQLI